VNRLASGVAAVLLTLTLLGPALASPAVAAGNGDADARGGPSVNVTHTVTENETVVVEVRLTGLDRGLGSFEGTVAINGSLTVINTTDTTAGMTTTDITPSMVGFAGVGVGVQASETTILRLEVDPAKNATGELKIRVGTAGGENDSTYAMPTKTATTGLTIANEAGGVTVTDAPRGSSGDEQGDTNDAPPVIPTGGPTPNVSVQPTANASERLVTVTVSNLSRGLDAVNLWVRVHPNATVTNVSTPVPGMAQTEIGYAFVTMQGVDLGVPSGDPVTLLRLRVVPPEVDSYIIAQVQTASANGSAYGVGSDRGRQKLIFEGLGERADDGTGAPSGGEASGSNGERSGTGSGSAGTGGGTGDAGSNDVGRSGGGDSRGDSDQGGGGGGPIADDSDQPLQNVPGPGPVPDGPPAVATGVGAVGGVITILRRLGGA